MPGTRITLAKNSQQTVRSVVVLNLHTQNPEEALRSILAVAEKKLRIRKPRRLFLAADGTEISPGTLSRVQNDVVLLVSAGEDYVGSAKQAPGDKAEAAPVTVLHSSESFLLEFVEPLAIDQLKQVARLPGVVKAVGMPDLHPSDSYPIGAAIESERCIYPVLIGGDVGCGMALYQTTLSCSTRPKRICEKLQGLEGSWKHGQVSEWLAKHGVFRTSLFDESLGTIGGGNHFAEIQQVEQVEDREAFAKLGLHEDKLVLLVHSGSRGLGKHIAHSQPVQLHENTPEFDSYMQEHEYACNWARCNRDLIAHRIMSCLSSNPDTSASKVLDIWHNNVTKKEIGGSGHVWLHRKGAAPSDQGAVVIPGSRGSFSYLVMPVGEQRENSFSLAHGAGRSLTRGVALNKMKNKAPTVNASAAALQETALGSRVICEDINLLFEEAPEAYKKIETVVEELVGSGVIKVVAVFRPVVTYKKRTE